MKKLKLTNLNQSNLDKSMMQNIQGGKEDQKYSSCCCGCLYASSGGSSSSANGAANNAGGLYSVDSFWCGTGNRT
jgi:natural product precursor